MGAYQFKAGDTVVVCGGHFGDVQGTVVKLMTDPRGPDHDLVTVRLHGDAKQVIMISLFSCQLRLATD